MPTSRSSLIATRVIAGAALIFLPALPTLAKFPPEKAENLKVLPEDTGVREVIGLMRTFAFGLGVRCEHCHVGQPGQPLDTFDFSSDEKQAKRTARIMMRMVNKINEEHLGEVGGDRGDRRTVECVTCHHGLKRPDTLGAALTRAHAEGGTEAAVGEYRRLREEHYGSGAYDFTEWRLLSLADTLARGGDLEAAEALIDLNLEYFPDASDSLMFQARFYQFQGNKERSAEILRKMLTVDPENERAKTMLERLEPPSEEP